jgi:hypothetical protein
VRPNPLRTAIRRPSWELRTLVGRWGLPARLLLRRSGEFPTEETEICIEGFQRSGNTFAVIAFQQAQSRTVSIAHHVHAPAAAIAAVRLGKPAIVLVRQPEGAVVSTVIRYPHLSLGQALRGYNRFYAPLLAYRDRVVVGGFDDIVNRFDAVIRAVNQKFGTAFGEFEPTEANVDRVLEEVDRWDLGAFGSGPGLELGRARPTEARARVQAELRERYRHPRLAGLRARAEELHESFVRWDGSSGPAY